MINEQGPACKEIAGLLKASACDWSNFYRRHVIPAQASVGQGEIKRGSFVHLSLRPDATAVTLNDALNDGQADAGAFEVLHSMQPLKDAEQLRRITHIEPGPVVANKINGFSILLA